MNSNVSRDTKQQTGSFSVISSLNGYQSTSPNKQKLNQTPLISVPWLCVHSLVCTHYVHWN